MTLHRRKVDDRTPVEGCDQLLDVPGGWQIADGSADDVRVCGAHPWQSYCLLFANGDGCGTAACHPSFIGNAQLRFSRKIYKKIRNPDPTKLKLNSGEKFNDGSPWLEQDEQNFELGARATLNICDVLLRKRA